MMDTSTVPGQPQGPVPAKRRAWPWILVVLIIGAAVVAALTVPLPTGIESELRPLSENENEYVNNTDGYTLPIPAQWHIFDEILVNERRGLSIDDIRDRLSSCGPTCAAFSTVIMGNYSATPCRSESCDSVEKTDGISLSIYGLANPERLDIDSFLTQAFSKASDSESIYVIVFGDEEEDGSAVEGRMERIFFEDDTELRTYYFDHEDRVYFFDQDLRIGEGLTPEDLFVVVQRAIGLMTMQ